MRTFSAAILLLAATLAFGAKKITLPTTTAANDKVDLEATITMDDDQVREALGANPGKGVVLLKVRVTPKVDTPIYISPDDFVLLASDDGERHKPFSPAEIAGNGAMVVSTTQASQKKSSAMAGLGGMMGGGGGSSPGNTPPVNVQAKMDDKKVGDAKLLEVLNAKAFPTATTVEPVEGFLYFALDGKHKLKNLEVLYRGAAGKLNMSFVQ
jgi:hypothetical protein